MAKYLPLSPFLPRTLLAFDDYTFSMLPPERMFEKNLLSVMIVTWLTFMVQVHTR